MPRKDKYKGIQWRRRELNLPEYRKMLEDCSISGLNFLYEKRLKELRELRYQDGHDLLILSKRFNKGEIGWPKNRVDEEIFKEFLFRQELLSLTEQVRNHKMIDCDVISSDPEMSKIVGIDISKDYGEFRGQLAHYEEDENGDYELVDTSDIIDDDEEDDTTY